MQRRGGKVAALLVIGAASAVILFQGLVTLALAVPATLSYAPPRLLADFRRHYSRYDRDVIQFNPECATYDPELFYRLRPGRCAFVNREFATEVEVNSLGLRDDEESLRAPQIVVLGDSMAMGWGVAQQETFPQRLERALGARVLNAAISSFGTVREMKLLARIDTSAMRTLIVQYSGNDLEENEAFFAAGNRYIARSEAEWNAVAAENGNLALARRLLGTLTFFGDASALRATVVDRTARPGAESPAQLFLNALMHAGSADLRGFDLVVVPLESWNRNSPTFAAELARAIRAGRYPTAIRQARIVDLSANLGDRDYFVLDGHLTAAGHKDVARQLGDVVSAPPQMPARQGAMSAR